MLNIPIQSHCYLIEPLSENKHIRLQLRQRFVRFISSVKKSTKQVLRQMLRLTQYDAGSVTGANLRGIMRSEGRNSIDELLSCTVSRKYRDIPPGADYRIGMIGELIKVRNDQLHIEGVQDEKTEDILKFLCTS